MDTRNKHYKMTKKYYTFSKLSIYILEEKNKLKNNCAFQKNRRQKY